MTIEQFNKTRWCAGMKVHCNLTGMQYEPYEADVVSVDFDQCLIGVMEEESDEIVTTEDGEKCIDCIEEEKFYQETMRGI